MTSDLVPREFKLFEAGQVRHEYINGIYCKKDGRLQPPKTWFDAHLVVLTGRETFCYQPYEDKWYQLAEIPFDGDIATRGNANNFRQFAATKLVQQS